MPYNIRRIEGIGDVYAGKLEELGIRTLEELLEQADTLQKRKALAERTGISEKLILEWANLADLFRIKGVGEEYSDLLEEAGVDTVVELAQRNPEHLHAKLADINAQKKLVLRLPSLREVTSWVEQAKSLPRVLQY